MIAGIHSASPAANALPTAENGDRDGQKNQTEVSHNRPEENPDVDSAGRTEKAATTSDTKAEEPDRSEPAQREVRAEPPAGGDELQGGLVDILG